MTCPPAPFQSRIRPAPRNGGFCMTDYWVWGGSPVRDEEGRWHLFASRWPKRYPFFEGYICFSEIVRAAADRPEGPYRFVEVVLPARGPDWWDGQMTHNPTIRKIGDEYVLFYIGATWNGPQPSAEELRQPAPRVCREIYRTIRIGIARAPSPAGPWRRYDRPILEPRPGKWDNTVVTNPAPVVTPDGRILLYYRSNTPNGLRIGLAAADRPEGPYRRVTDEPVLNLPDGNFVEDPFAWWNGACFEMLAKDMTGGITGEKHAGVHLWSRDGLDWRLAERPQAWSRRVLWDDGTTTVQGNVERPQLLFDDDGNPAYLFAATSDGPGGFRNARNTWTMVLPLGPASGTAY